MTNDPSTPTPSTGPGRAAAALDLPAGRRVELVVGPGGVGKTTVAAALALRAAVAGRRTVVVTIDPSRRLAQALGIDGGAMPGTLVAVNHAGATLDCLVLDTQHTFDAIVRAHSPSPEAAEAMLVNPIYRAMVRYLGGALEYAATAQVHMLAAAGQHDLIVLDTPPTANAIEFLEAPAQIAEVANNPAAKFLSQSGRFGMRFLGLGSGLMLKALEAVGGGAFIGDLGRFLRDFGQVLEEFQRRAGALAGMMTSPGTGVVLTTSATDFSVREALAFLSVLAERGLRIDGVVLNRFDTAVPPWPGDAVIAAALDGAPVGVDRVAALHGALLRQATSAQRGADALRGRWPTTPVCTVPRMDPPPTTLAELHALATAVWPNVRR